LFCLNTKLIYGPYIRIVSLKLISDDYYTLAVERAGHGEEIALSTDLSLYSGIVIVSGDGLLFEVSLLLPLVTRTNGVMTLMWKM